MEMLARRVDFVIGVDTHRDSHTAAVLNALGGVEAELTVPADRRGYRRLLALGEERAPGRRLWAIEGTGSYGSGLTTFLLERSEWVAEVDRPKRSARRNGAKSDPLDAARAGREALASTHLAQPRRRGEREAIRVLLVARRGALGARTRAINHLKSLVVSAPEDLRAELRGLGGRALIRRCAGLRRRGSAELEATALALRLTARRILALEAEAKGIEARLEELVRVVAPRLLAECGVGVISAAQILCAWSHPGRIRSEAAFATLAGSAPIPASSGKTVRHRLNRGGDRQLNRALHALGSRRVVELPR